MTPVYDVVVVGKANIDYVARGPRLPARVALVGRVGSDARGDAVVLALQAEGVDVRHISRDRETATGVALCQVDELGRKQILSSMGPMRGSPLPASAMLPRCSAALALTQLGIPRDACLEAIQLGRSGGARIVLDPARQTAREAAQQLLRRGVKAAIVQAANLGDVLLCQDGEVWLPRFELTPIDATGAGDAFSSALAVCLAEGKPLPEAGRFASAAAALATTVLGAQSSLPRRAAVLQLLATS